MSEGSFVVLFNNQLIERGFALESAFALAVAGEQPMRASERRLVTIEYEDDEYQALLVHDGEGNYDIRYPKKSMIRELLKKNLTRAHQGEAAFTLRKVRSTVLTIAF